MICQDMTNDLRDCKNRATIAELGFPGFGWSPWYLCRFHARKIAEADFFSDPAFGSNQHKIDDLVCEFLKVDLPHGSGIDYDWNVEKRGRKYYASNSYHAMDDFGGYCCINDFTATLRLEENGDVVLERIVLHDFNNHAHHGGRADLKDYLSQTIDCWLTTREESFVVRAARYAREESNN
jgi:hypothetical protein